jgi:uncharacterized protein YaaN involved in tellurite resistance
VPDEADALNVTDNDALKSELTELTIDPDSQNELGDKADQVVDRLMAIDPANHDARASGNMAAEGIGLDIQQMSARKLDMLKAPVHRIVDRGDSRGDVGTSLADLKVEVEKADPRRFNFDPGWFSRVLGYLPFIGPPLKRYFTQYESTRTVIDAIIKSLENGRSQLKRDNVVLADDQKEMREITQRLAGAVELGQMVDERLAARIETLDAADPKRKFLNEEVVFPLRQRILDLQQQLAVNQQGILATEIIVRNNKELVRGVDRAVNVTARALQVAATIAIALADQKAVLDKVESVNEVTSDLIASTAEQLKDQGTQIQKQASSAMLDINALKSAFADIDVAIEDLSRFRTQALPMMAQSVAELDAVTAKAEASIEKLDATRYADNPIKIDV